MKGRSVAWRWFAVLVLGMLLVGTAGCTYLKHRYEDFGEMVDVGITYSEKPCIGLYWNSLDIFPVGYSEIDGWFIGWGGGQVGITRHYNKCWGFGYGEEHIGWGDGLDGDDPDSSIIKRRSGVIGILSSILDVGEAPYGSGPNYTPACVHFVPHVAYIGVVWNARYTEMVDFMLGWTTLDICGDDGYDVGKWSFPWRAGE